MFICHRAAGLAAWFAPACLHIAARDNSIVSRSDRRRYGLRKLVRSCCNHSRNSLICSYHAELQCSFPSAVVPLRPVSVKAVSVGPETPAQQHYPEMAQAIFPALTATFSFLRDPV